MAEAVRRRPGPAPSLSRSQVARAALEVMAEQGLDAVSFRNVSKRLGVNPMALYTYVKDKDDLLAGMYDEIVSELKLPEGDDSPVEQLVAFYTAARRLILENADLHRLVRPAAVPGMDWAMLERLCHLLGELGLDAAGVLATQQLLLQFTMGHALHWAALGGDGQASGATQGGLDALAELDAVEYPALHALRDALRPVDPEAEFVATLRWMLRAAVAERAQAGPASPAPEAWAGEGTSR